MLPTNASMSSPRLANNVNTTANIAPADVPYMERIRDSSTFPRRTCSINAPKKRNPIIPPPDNTK